MLCFHVGWNLIFKMEKFRNFSREIKIESEKYSSLFEYSVIQALTIGQKGPIWRSSCQNDWTTLETDQDLLWQSGWGGSLCHHLYWLQGMKSKLCNSVECSEIFQDFSVMTDVSTTLYQATIPRALQGKSFLVIDQILVAKYNDPPTEQKEALLQVWMHFAGFVFDCSKITGSCCRLHIDWGRLALRILLWVPRDHQLLHQVSDVNWSGNSTNRRIQFLLFEALNYWSVIVLQLSWNKNIPVTFF